MSTKFKFDIFTQSIILSNASEAVMADFNSESVFLKFFYLANHMCTLPQTLAGLNVAENFVVVVGGWWVTWLLCLAPTIVALELL